MKPGPTFPSVVEINSAKVLPSRTSRNPGTRLFEKSSSLQERIFQKVRLLLAPDGPVGAS